MSERLPTRAATAYNTTHNNIFYRHTYIYIYMYRIILYICVGVAPSQTFNFNL